MHTLILALIVATILSLALIVAAEALRRPRNLEALANVAEGVWAGRKTYYTDAAVTAKNLLCTAGSDDRHVAICGVSDIPRGVMKDEASAAEEILEVALFGCHAETELGVASGAISEEDEIVAGAGGTVRTLPVASGTYYIIGRALADAADTEDVMYLPSPPVQRVVA